MFGRRCDRQSPRNASATGASLLSVNTLSLFLIGVLDGDCDGCVCLVNDTLDFNVAEIVVNGLNVVVDTPNVFDETGIFRTVGFKLMLGLRIGRNDSVCIICGNPVNVI